jgi:hypothetical protein
VRSWSAETGQKVGYAHAEGYYRITLKEVEGGSEK